VGHLEDLDSFADLDPTHAPRRLPFAAQILLEIGRPIRQYIRRQPKPLEMTNQPRLSIILVSRTRMQNVIVVDVEL
jgi:hypothetical protein